MDPWPGPGGGPVVGVDVSSVERVGQLLERRPRFASKYFSPAERAYCEGRPERLAARWAAKEAVRKAFGAAGWRIPLYSRISVERRPGGAPRALVEGSPVAGLEISLSHDAGLGMAVAALLPRGRSSGWLFGDPEGLELPERDPEANKGTFGTVLVLAGSPSFPGAAVLCSLGALRGGAGKVKAVLARGAADSFPAEVVRVPVRAAGEGLGPDVLVQARADLDSARALVCGPGLGGAAEVRELLASLFGLAGGAGWGLVLDADALNACAAEPGLRAAIPPRSVLTPHPLEAARLAGAPVGEIGSDREGWARRLARELGAVLVLKGAGTVVATPEGQLWVDQHRAPALAAGGTGDVLAGLLGALLAQGLEPFQAARTGVFLHGEAGVRLGLLRGRAGILASEVAAALVETQEAVRRELAARPASNPR